MHKIAIRAERFDTKGVKELNTVQLSDQRRREMRDEEYRGRVTDMD
jgi:hypothetical protein